MKVAIIYNRDSKQVINLFGMPNKEKIGMRTIRRIAAGLKQGGHQVVSLEGDKNLIDRLEDFMPRVVKGERPGMVFNLSYGIQGQARYAHVPSILEMVGIPYVGSGPLAHSLALDKAVAKMIFKQHGIATPEYAIMDSPDAVPNNLSYPLIVKPKNEAVSFGIRIVNNPEELREGVRAILDQFNQPVLVEQYITDREINIGLIGNNPPDVLPPVELLFGEEGPAIYTYDDKRRASGREIGWECPAKLDRKTAERAQELALKAFTALGCYDCARVDMRLDRERNLFVLEVNSLPSLGEHGSYTIAAERAGLDFNKLVCRLIDVASARYFGTPAPPDIAKPVHDIGKKIFSFLVERRDEIEKRVQEWVMLSSRTADLTGILEAQKKLARFCDEMGLSAVPELTDGRSIWTWQTKAGLDDGTLLIGHLDIPLSLESQAQMFRRDPEWLFGEGVGISRAPLVAAQFALRSLRNIRRLRQIPLGLVFYSDEGRDCRYSHELIEAASKRSARVLVLRPGNPDNSVVSQRRGWRKYRLTVSGKSQRLGKNYKHKGVLRWVTSCLDEISSLTSKENRLAVACSSLKSESYPLLLPHRAVATILVSFSESGAANRAEQEIRKIVDTREYSYTFELISKRPPMKKTRRSEQFLKSLFDVASEWNIPLAHESSLFPSVAGYVSPPTAVICGVGPVARDIDTPRESVLRLSLMQRTLLLAQFLARQTPNGEK